jgi:hypothetical protein
VEIRTAKKIERIVLEGNGNEITSSKIKLY